MSNKEKTTNFIGNGSTFLKYLCFLVSGRLLALAVAHGINLPVDQYTLAEFLGYVLGIIGATIDAKYHNNINWNLIKSILGFSDISNEESQELASEITFADTGKYPEDNIEDLLDSGDDDDT